MGAQEEFYSNDPVIEVISFNFLTSFKSQSESIVLSFIYDKEKPFCKQNFI